MREMATQTEGMRKSFQAQTSEALDNAGTQGAAFDRVNDALGGMRAKMVAAAAQGVTSAAVAKQLASAHGDVAAQTDLASKSVAAHAKAIQSLTDKLSGAGAIKAAGDMLEALKKTIPIHQMTRDAQLDIVKTMDAAIDVYRAAGKTIPEDWLLIGNAARIASATTIDGLDGIVAAVHKLASVKIEIPIAPIPTLEIMNGLKELPGQIVGMPSIPKVPIFEKIFGTPKELGTQLVGMFAHVFSGGGIVNGLKQMGTQIGTEFVGGILNAVPVIGPMLSQFAGPLVEGFKKIVGKIAGLFDRNKGRDIVEDFVKGFGGFDAFHQMLGEKLPADAERLWTLLTQGVGRNNPAQAHAAIDEVNAALARQAQQHADVQAAAEQASATQLAAQQQAKTAIEGLNSEILSLQKSIESEAPEDVMGVVEAQARARLAALTEERAAAQQHLDEMLSHVTSAIEDVAETFRRLPKVLDFDVNLHTHSSGAETFHTGTAKVLPFVIAHNGLLPDEVPAILQTGEAVLNRRAAAAMGTHAIGALNRGDRPASNRGVESRLDEVRKELAQQRAQANADRRFLLEQLPKAITTAIQKGAA